MQKKETEQLIRQLRVMDGVEVELQRSGKWRVKGPRGVYWLHQTNSERRGYKNALTCLRRIGIEL